MSIPIDLSDEPELVKLEEKGVKGRYVSVERLQELENGNVEWRMATSSTPGGKIPSFIAESTMDSAISQVRSPLTVPCTSIPKFSGLAEPDAA